MQFFFSFLKHKKVGFPGLQLLPLPFKFIYWEYIGREKLLY